MSYCYKCCIITLGIILLSACGSRNELAPVTESKWRPISTYPGTHVVRAGETLYAIAFRYDTDFRQLALLNHLQPPYSLRIGQVLRVQGAAGRRLPAALPQSRQVAVAKPVTQQRFTTVPFYAGWGTSWYWPVNGRVVTSFIPEQGKKGINIACTRGDKVRAAASGTVAYAGSGLAGYGNLIIIKHNAQFLTAYGNNTQNLVKEGQRVSAGQVIAQVGIIDRKYWGVHFEIRKNGMPVNPLSYLKKR